MLNAIIVLLVHVYILYYIPINVYLSLYINLFQYLCIIFVVLLINLYSFCNLLYIKFFFFMNDKINVFHLFQSSNNSNIRTNYVYKYFHYYILFKKNNSINEIIYIFRLNTFKQLQF